MSSASSGYWRPILAASIIITIVSIASLPYLYENISGDGVPNNSPKGSLIEYQWDIAVYRIVIAVISLAAGIYSYNKIRKT